MKPLCFWGIVLFMIKVLESISPPKRAPTRTAAISSGHSASTIYVFMKDVPWPVSYGHGGSCRAWRACGTMVTEN